MADAGWAAVSWPREYGGRGATPLEQLVYAEETTRARVPIPLNTIGINNIAPAIMQYGTDQQKDTLLNRMVRADDIWCQGMSEPDSGSDLASLRTRAVRSSDSEGDCYVVNGQKIWTSVGNPPACRAQRRRRLRRGVVPRRPGARGCAAGSTESRLAGRHHHTEPRKSCCR